MISRQDFINEVEASGFHTVTMSIKQIERLFQARNVDMCVWRPEDSSLEHKLLKVLEISYYVLDDTDEFVFCRSKDCKFLQHYDEFSWLFEHGYSFHYFIIPTDELPLDLEEII